MIILSTCPFKYDKGDFLVPMDSTTRNGKLNINHVHPVVKDRQPPDYSA